MWRSNSMASCSGVGQTAVGEPFDDTQPIVEGASP
jgi:hypothetical protein